MFDWLFPDFSFSFFTFPTDRDDDSTSTDPKGFYFVNGRGKVWEKKGFFECGSFACRLEM
jgi:hypothetical protein